MPRTPNPVGHPTKYDPAFCGRVVVMGQQGMGKRDGGRTGRRLLQL